MKISFKPIVQLLFWVTLLSGCVTMPPNSPSVMALPGSSSTFEKFRIDDTKCRSFALDQTTATVSTDLRATGTNNVTMKTASSFEEMQRRYDISYLQCMYAKGNKIPIPGTMTGNTARGNNVIPPPPPGLPPPPPKL